MQRDERVTLELDCVYLKHTYHDTEEARDGRGELMILL
jgi:hypothetical protein